MKKKTIQTAAIISLLCCSLVPASPSLSASIKLAQKATSQPFGNEGLSFGDRLNKLEQVNNLPPPQPQASVIERLARLEFKLFGQGRTGSIVDRLNNLEGVPQAPPAMQYSANDKTLPATLPGLTGYPAAGVLAAQIKQAHVAAMVNIPDIYPPRFLHMPVAGDNQLDNSDYLNAVMEESKNKVLRFQKMPIPYYITPINEFGFPKAIREAFNDWTLRTDGLVKFIEVKNKNAARIIVTFNHLGANKNTQNLGAHTMANWKSRGSGRLAVIPVGSIPVPLYIPAMGPKYTVPPQVIEVNLDVIFDHEEDARLMLLKNICTHEAGHALGMLGHSPNKNDMMYSVTDEHSRLSQRDINTLTRLYQRKADIPL